MPAGVTRAKKASAERSEMKARGADFIAPLVYRAAPKPSIRASRRRMREHVLRMSRVFHGIEFGVEVRIVIHRHGLFAVHPVLHGDDLAAHHGDIARLYD